MHSADAAFDEGERHSWIEFGTGLRIGDPSELGP
jgi:hypothetical protein